MDEEAVELKKLGDPEWKEGLVIDVDWLGYASKTQHSNYREIFKKGITHKD